MPKRDRERRSARREPFKDSRPTILIVCEGRVTEPEYLRDFYSDLKNPRVKIHFGNGEAVPLTIVRTARDLRRDAEEQARRERDDNLAYDEVWCVFDIDDHPRIPEAQQMARDNDLRLAISNPCFELWLLLHFREPPGAKHRHDLQSMLTEHLPDYKKRVNFSLVSQGYDAAVKRAKRLENAADSADESGRNPTTGVWRLTEGIRESS